MKYFFDNNFKKYRIKELKDNLTLEIIKEKFQWILKKDLNNLSLGIHVNKLVVYIDQNKYYYLVE